MSDECQRCGEFGEDRRTLWMACSYEMGETGLPLQSVQITGVYAEQTGVDESYGLRMPIFTAAPDAVSFGRRFYLMTVCKDCRADWMAAQVAWFKAPAREDVTPLAGQVLVRKFGTTVAITPP